MRGFPMQEPLIVSEAIEMPVPASQASLDNAEARIRDRLRLALVAAAYQVPVDRSSPGLMRVEVVVSTAQLERAARDAVWKMADAPGAALRRIEHVLGLHGCPQGADMDDWIREQLYELKALRLGVKTYEEYMNDMDESLKEFGYAPGKLRQPWLKEQLHELRARRAADAIARASAPTTPEKSNGAPSGRPGIDY